MRRRLFIFLLVVLTVGPAVAQDQSISLGSGYKVGAGDVLKITAHTHDEVSGEFAIEADGAITFPFLGRMEVAGHTTSEIATQIEDLLERDYYVDVQLQVEVEEFRSKLVTILGEVSRPGTYYLEGPTSLHKILADSGGIKSSAGALIELRRPIGNEDDATPLVRVFRTKAVRTGEEGRDVVLKPGDVVFVTSKQKYFITGEVTKPGQYELSPGMTLMQAISDAGGRGKFASQNVEIHRGSESEKEISTFDLSKIRKGKSVDPVIEAGDVLIIRRRFF